MRSKDDALNFGRAAADYDRGRPSYPDAAVDWLLARTRAQDGPLEIADVGAGTGKLTRSLVGPGRRVTAVEPDPVMRQRLSGNLPGVKALAGTAESLPLEASSLDLVTFGQAWHWVDVPAASAEAARVLRPTGRLALVWNLRDERVDWVARLGEIMGSSPSEDYDARNPLLAPPLTPVDYAEFEWQNPLEMDQLIAMVASRSYIIALPATEREALLRRVRELAAAHPELRGRQRILMPYVTRVTLAARDV